MEELSTFHGKLIPSSVSNHVSDNAKESQMSTNDYIQYLESQVAILDEIVYTSKLICGINSNLFLDLNQKVSIQKADVGTQASPTDIRLSIEMLGTSQHIEYDGQFDAPHSFMVTNEDGEIQASNSMLEKRTDWIETKTVSNNQWCRRHGTLSFSNVSSASDLEHLIEELSNVDDVDLLAGPPCSSDYQIEPISPIDEIIQGKLCDDVGKVDLDKDELSTSNCDLIPAAEIIDGTPFSYFSVETLLNELEFTHDFHNRKVLYFGIFPYSYSGGKHCARDIPEKSYLAAICSYFDAIFPHYEYNSVLINYYSSGLDYMPLHSDSEDCIEDDSLICTISLGATRTLQFTNKEGGAIVASTELTHGGVFMMTKSSQDLYKHKIPPDVSCTNARVSITFRLIKPEIPSRRVRSVQVNNLYDDSQGCGYLPFSDHASSDHLSGIGNGRRAMHSNSNTTSQETRTFPSKNYTGNTNMTTSHQNHGNVT